MMVEQGWEGRARAGVWVWVREPMRVEEGGIAGTAQARTGRRANEARLVGCAFHYMPKGPLGWSWGCPWYGA